MFAKPLRQLDAQDIERVCAEAVQEDANVEFKSALPAKQQVGDPWIGGASMIGDYAKTAIVKEVVAFANAYGGVLILGIEETQGKPARAAEIAPIPRCHELAERLRLVCRDTIEPQVPLLDAVGVVTTDEGAGVVVIQVPQSRSAPHRHMGDWQCYFRHADRSEKMPMREIQDLTLRVRQGLEDIESNFEISRHGFHEAISEIKGNSSDLGVLGIRVALVPLTPIRIEHVHRVEEAKPTSRSLKGYIQGAEIDIIDVPTKGAKNWRPIIRGSEAREQSGLKKQYISVHDDGRMNLQWIKGEEDQYYALYPNWVISMFANSLLSANRFRISAGSPNSEFGLEYEIAIASKSINVMNYGGQISMMMGEIPPGSHLFPRSSIGPVEEFPMLVKVFEQDFWNLTGTDWESDIEVIFD